MGNKLILAFGVLSLIFLVIIISSHSIFHYNHTVQDQKEKAWVLGNTLAKSLELPMLEGKMNTLQEMLVTVGELENFERVHLTDDQGMIRYSSIPERINTPTGSIIIKQALKERKSIGNFEQRGDDYIFSLALPILNEPRCYNCHGQKKDILGVLRIGIDWAPMKKTLSKVLQRDVFVSLIFYIVIILLSFLFQRLYTNAQIALNSFKQAQEQLIKTEKMAAVGQMAAAISHDLRNPLTGIKMATYYLNSKIDENNIEQQNILKDIELEINYASNVVTNILTYSRPTDLIFSRSNINKIIEETMNFIHLQNRDASFEIIKNYDLNLPEIFIDNKQIKQVIINVISNAIQAMPKGGQLKISTRTNGSFIEIIIEDSGVGIPKKVLENIYTPFFTTRARGVGLGLSIVSNIVKKHGGQTQISSTLGKGTKFIVRLPIFQDIENKRMLEHDSEES
ncbi:MAG: ATP-binding protein [Candidatus Omnitrophota bacterium]